MSIQPEEVELVRRTWKRIVSDPEANGCLILKGYLDKYNYYSKFTKFKLQPGVNIEEDPAFIKHAVLIIKTIDAAIEKLHEPDDYTTRLKNLGAQHALRKIEKQQFDEFEAFLLDIFEREYNMDKNELDAWAKTFGVTFSLIVGGLEKKKAELA